MTTTQDTDAPRPLNRSEQELLDLLVRGTLDLAPIATKHSTWLLAVGGAAAALLVGHLDDLQKLNRLAQLSFGLSTVLLAVALVFGLVARWKATSLDIILAGSALGPQAAALAEAHAEREDDEDVDGERVMAALAELVPKRAQKHLDDARARLGGRPLSFAQLQGKSALRAFGAQHTLLRLQYAFTFLAALFALLGVGAQFIGG